MPGLKRYIEEYWLPALISAAALGLSLYLQQCCFWSPMALPEEMWEAKLKFHMTWHPFAVRIWQSYATLAMNKLTGLAIKQSFFVIQYGLAMGLGLLFYRYLRHMLFDRIWANLGVVLLMTAYPVIGAHFEPTHTWDDIWSYIFLILLLLAVMRDRWILAGVYLVLGLFAREQILLLYPILILWAWWSRKQVPTGRQVIGLVFPVAVYFLYRLLLWEEIDPKRWQLLLFNFDGEGRINDTIVSAIIAFGFMWLTSLLGWMSVVNHGRIEEKRYLATGGAIFVGLTVLFTFVLTFARETRIFFPPFVFVIPLTLYFLRTLWRSYFCRLHPVWWLVSTVVLFIFGWAGYRSAVNMALISEYKINADLRVPLAGVHVGLMAAILTGYVALLLKHIYRRGRDKRRIKQLISYMEISLISAFVILIVMVEVVPIVKGPALQVVGPVSGHHMFGSAVRLEEISLEETGGHATAIRFKMESMEPIKEANKIFLHLYPSDGSNKKILDFLPDIPVNLWMPGNDYTLRRVLDVAPGTYKVSVGIFSPCGRIGQPYNFFLQLK
ncbi:MAG: hypothetical protein AB1483_12575 [Candidatus Zixiibacteriota bacterium]